MGGRERLCCRAAVAEERFEHGSGLGTEASTRYPFAI